MNNLILLLICSAIAMILSGCQQPDESLVPVNNKMDLIVTDTINEAFLRDSSLFLTVVIGSQTWMKNDLQLTEFLNGDPISEARNNQEWIKFAKQKKPCFRKVGKSIFYNGYSLMDERGLVPDEFKIPSAYDWDVLLNELGGFVQMSKDISSYSWNENIQNQLITVTGNNASGFNAQPSGFIYSSGSYAKGSCSFWWVNSSAQSLIPTKLTIFNIGFCDSEISRGMVMDPAFGATLRCIKKKV